MPSFVDIDIDTFDELPPDVQAALAGLLMSEQHGLVDYWSSPESWNYIFGCWGCEKVTRQ